MSRPLGRRQPSRISPTGSGRDGIWRNPSAMLEMREGVKVSLSMRDGVMPFFCAVDASEAFAIRMISWLAQSASAMAHSALFLAAVVAQASLEAAALA